MNLARSTNLSQHSLLFEVINDAFSNSRGCVYTHLLGKASTRQDHQSTAQPHQEWFYQAGPNSRESLGEQGKRTASTWSPLSLPQLAHVVLPTVQQSWGAGYGMGISCQEAGPDCTRGE